MSENPHDRAFKIVKAGYDTIGNRYTTERGNFMNREEFDEFYRLLPEKARVLDAGSGTGIPVARELVGRGYQIVGIDLSNEMLSVARKNVPQGKFVPMNMTEIDFPPESFDGVVSCYAIIHVPRELHARIFRSFHSVLKPGGVMLVSVACWAWEEVADYMGTEMFWSHHDPDESQRIIRDAGFEIQFGRPVETGGEKHFWVLALRA